MTCRPSPQLSNQIRREFPTLFHIIDILPRVGIIPPSKSDGKGSIRSEESLEEYEDDRVVRVVVPHAYFVEQHDGYIQMVFTVVVAVLYGGGGGASPDNSAIVIY